MRWILYILIGFCTTSAGAQSAEDLISKAREKLNKVHTYKAEAVLQTNVAFIKAPIAEVEIYYRKPGQLKIVSKKGISFVPKGADQINVTGLLPEAGAFDMVDAGKDAGGLRMIRLLPKSESSEVVLSTLYVDEKTFLIRKARITTKENGTNELEMIYGKYADYGLPDKVIFTFNTKDYKMMKGVAMDYEGAGKKQGVAKDRKGKVNITYRKYEINRSIPDKVFH